MDETTGARSGAGHEAVTPERLLADAAERIAEGWCRTSLAEDRRGRRVAPWADTACCWSPLGALLAVWSQCHGAGSGALGTAYAALALATGGRPEEWNAAPWRTRRHVLSAFTRARTNVPDARRQLREGSTERD